MASTSSSTLSISSSSTLVDAKAPSPRQSPQCVSPPPVHSPWKTTAFCMSIHLLQLLCLITQLHYTLWFDSFRSQDCKQCYGNGYHQRGTRSRSCHDRALCCRDARDCEDYSRSCKDQSQILSISVVTFCVPAD